MIVKNCTLIKPLKCSLNSSIADVARILKKEKQRRIIVIDENEYPVGIISTTDMSNRVVAENRDASKLTANEIMTTPVYLVCDMDDDLNEIFRKMVHHETFFVPVTQNGKLHGILTYGELLKHAQEQSKKPSKK